MKTEINALMTGVECPNIAHTNDEESDGLKEKEEEVVVIPRMKDHSIHRRRGLKNELRINKIHLRTSLLFSCAFS
jgi:hypothetical protein